MSGAKAACGMPKRPLHLPLNLWGDVRSAHRLARMRYLCRAAQVGFRRKTKHPTILRMAQPPQAAAPHKRTKRHLSGDELLRLLNEYAFSGLSWHKWMNMHRADHHRNELEALKHELLATYALPIHPTLTCPGAYIPLYHLTVTLLQELIDRHLLPYREDDIMLNYPQEHRLACGIPYYHHKLAEPCASAHMGACRPSRDRTASSPYLDRDPN